MIECQKKIEVGSKGILVAYCISKPGHPGKCKPDPFLVNHALEYMEEVTIPHPIPFVPAVFGEAK